MFKTSNAQKLVHWAGEDFDPNDKDLSRAEVGGQNKKSKQMDVVGGLSLARGAAETMESHDLSENLHNKGLEKTVVREKEPTYPTIDLAGVEGVGGLLGASDEVSDPPALSNFKKITVSHNPDVYSEAYETAVSGIRGHKRAYNSMKYGTLVLDQSHVKMTKSKKQRQVYLLDSEREAFIRSEASHGYKVPVPEIARMYLTQPRTVTSSTLREGAVQRRRGFNQYRNKAITREVYDLDPEQVPVQPQTDRSAFTVKLMPGTEWVIHPKDRQAPQGCKLIEQPVGPEAGFHHPLYQGAPPTDAVATGPFSGGYPNVGMSIS